MKKMYIYNNVHGMSIRISVNILSLLCLGFIAVACSELEDKDHYKDYSSILSSSDDLVEVNVSSEEFLKGSSEFSSMSQFFIDQGIYQDASEKGFSNTLLVVDNDAFIQPDAADAKDIAQQHVSDASVAPTQLTSGKLNQIYMWTGKTIDVEADDEARENFQLAGHIKFVAKDSSTVRKVVKTTTGYIYVISNMMGIRESLDDYITKLSEDTAKYSILMDVLHESGAPVFNKKKSKAVGIDSEGNTVYDPEVYDYTYTKFQEKNIDFTSETLRATFLVAENDVIKEAVENARERLQKWGMYDTWNYDRIDAFEHFMHSWILDAAFYNKEYTAEELQVKDNNNLLTSIFGKYWKTSVQEIDPVPYNLSNAVVYKVKKLHIPNNVLIYRIKEQFDLYSLCDADQKAKYFASSNMGTFNVKTGAVSAWTPLAGTYPPHQNDVLVCNAGTAPTDTFKLDFTLLQRLYQTRYSWTDRVEKGSAYNGIVMSSGNKVEPFLIPPGEYRVAFGSIQNTAIDLYITIWADSTYFEGGMEKDKWIPIATSPKMRWDNDTQYHYDRGSSLSNTYPEFYDKTNPNIDTSTKADYPGSNGYKKDYYDTDGALLFSNLVVPDYNNGKGVKIKMTFMGPTWNDKSNITFNHWCFRPTANNY